MKLNKKGENTLLSIWWFFVLTVVGAGIVGGVLIYHSSDLDARGFEASALADKLVSCVNSEGQLNEQIFSDVFSECGLERKMFEIESPFYFKIDVSSENRPIGAGDNSIEEDCKIAVRVKEAEHYPICEYRKINLEYQGKSVEVNIAAGSNQIGTKGVS